MDAQETVGDLQVAEFRRLEDEGFEQMGQDADTFEQKAMDGKLVLRCPTFVTEGHGDKAWRTKDGDCPSEADLSERRG